MQGKDPADLTPDGIMLADEEKWVSLSFYFPNLPGDGPLLGRPTDTFLPDNQPPVNIGQQLGPVLRKPGRHGEEMIQEYTTSAFVPKDLVFLGPGRLTGPLKPIVQDLVDIDGLFGQEKDAEVGIEVLTTGIGFLKRFRQDVFPVYFIPIGPPVRIHAIRVTNNPIQQEGLFQHLERGGGFRSGILPSIHRLEIIADGHRIFLPSPIDGLYQPEDIVLVEIIVTIREYQILPFRFRDTPVPDCPKAPVLLVDYPSAGIGRRKIIAKPA